MPKKIYIIEDDAVLAKELTLLLEMDGYEARACEDFQHAVELARAFEPDCILLDLNLPNADGREICRDIRAQSDVPMIVLTSMGDEFTEVMCIKLGAHDFIAKPYRPAALLARIASLIQRRESSSGSSVLLERAGVTLDLGRSEVSYRDNTALITRNEQRILELLMRSAGAIVSRQEIMCALWESDAFIDDNTLTVNVNRLRKALSGIGVSEDFLQTRRSQGYVIE